MKNHKIGYTADDDGRILTVREPEIASCMNLVEEILEEAGIDPEYAMLTGGTALNAWAWLRRTEDIDCDVRTGHEMKQHKHRIRTRIENAGGILRSVENNRLNARLVGKQGTAVGLTVYGRRDLPTELLPGGRWEKKTGRIQGGRLRIAQPWYVLARKAKGRLWKARKTKAKDIHDLLACDRLRPGAMNDALDGVPKDFLEMEAERIRWEIRRNPHWNGDGAYAQEEIREPRFADLAGPAMWETAATRMDEIAKSYETRESEKTQPKDHSNPGWKKSNAQGRGPG